LPQLAGEHALPKKGSPAAMASATTMTGAQFEIRIDGTPRSYRDRRDYAMEAARLIKSKNPHSMVEVKDLKSGDVTAVSEAKLGDTGGTAALKSGNTEQ
jgi:hypothetical protein